MRAAQVPAQRREVDALGVRREHAQDTQCPRRDDTDRRGARRPVGQIARPGER
ncbi:hypothetical protein GCM10023200_09640 [Actinomycetospora chlora]|uniref:Uncharacterized protein n=1 Tax=Actinomycetospora chlora TaxID=663608 RepID=A0ABP9AC09_9PSEU